MEKWGKCDFSQLEQLSKRMEQLLEVDLDRFCREAAYELAARLQAKVVKLTPTGVPPEFQGPLTTKVRGESRLVQTTTKSGETVFRKRKGKSYTMLTKNGAIRQQYWAGYKGGTLKNAWAIMPVGHHGNHYTVVLLNPTKYASYVEHGHRQQPGRYVPALGKRLRVSWVKGRYMLTISTQEIERQAPAILEKRLFEFMKGCFNAE